MLKEDVLLSRHVDNKNRISVPQNILEKAGLRKGDAVNFTLMGSEIRIKRAK